MKERKFVNIFVCLMMIATVFVVAVPKDVEAEEEYLPDIPGFNVETYAVLPGPASIWFDPEGTLYVGNDDRYTGGSGLGTARIRRIGVGGSPIEEIGEPIGDPDTAVVDLTGIISGTAGSILAGGYYDAPTCQNGYISMISPVDGSTSLLFGPAPFPRNPQEMVIDGTGRLLFTDPDNIMGAGYTKIYESTGDFPTVLFDISGKGNYPLTLAVDSADRLYVSDRYGKIFVHDSTGTQIVNPFESGASENVGLAIGPGDAVWGDDLYVMRRDVGKLLRFDIQQDPFQINTIPTVIGTGFFITPYPDEHLYDLVFGPDNALYASELRVFNNNWGRIIRISPINNPPVADVGGPYNSYEGSEITFDASGSSDPDDDPLQYRWDFESDGNWDTDWSESPTAPYTWFDDHLGTVKVEVSDGALTDTAEAGVTIFNADPIITSISSPLDPTPVGTPTEISAQFTDPGILDTHTAEINWGDGEITEGEVDEVDGSGSVIGSHTYTIPGVYLVKLRVWDKDSGEDSISTEYIVQYDPYGAFVTGGGMIDSPVGAFPDDPTLTGKAGFGFVSKYQKGANVPDGNTQFRFHAADINFQSDSYEWLVVAGPKAIFKGTGTINGEGNYGFLISAIDGDMPGGGGVDMFRIKIWDKDNFNTIVYDNGLGDDDDANPGSPLTHGSIKIHKG